MVEMGPRRPIRGTEQGWAANQPSGPPEFHACLRDHCGPEPTVLARDLAGGRWASSGGLAGKTWGGEQVFYPSSEELMEAFAPRLACSPGDRL